MLCHPDIRALSPSGECPLCEPVEAPQAPAPSGAISVAETIKRGKAATTELCRRSLYKFLIEGWHVLEPTVKLETHWHIKALCDHVQWMFEQWMGKVPRQAQNLIGNVPPGTLKSRIFSVYGPAWAWLHRPEMSFLCLSSTPGVALRDADYNKELVQSEWYRETFGVQWEVRTDADAKGLFKTTAGGVRQSQGLNAKVTGIRADAIIFDDPNDVKDTSEVKLLQVARNWLAARNRLNDLRIGIRMGVQQRTHELDLTGHLLEQGGWQHLCIPMEYTEAKCACGADKCDTLLGKADPRTQPGQVLQPERNTPEVLAEELKGMRSLAYAGQMNQRPAPEGGAMFKLSYWRYYNDLPREKATRSRKFGQGVMSVDCTFGKPKEGETKKKRDRVGIVVMFPNGPTRYIAYAWAKQASFLETCKKIAEVYKMFIDPELGDPMIGKILIEKKANGEAVIETLQSPLYGIPGVVAYEPKGSKESRAAAALPTIEAGDVRLLRDAPWVDEYKAEMASFPNGAWDDLVDATAQAISDMSSGSAGNRLLARCAL